MTDNTERLLPGPNNKQVTPIVSTKVESSFVSDQEQNLINNEEYDRETPDPLQGLTKEDEEDLWYDESRVKDIAGGVKKRLLIIMAICSTFICAEVIGGIISGSLAILADASHLGCDLIGFGLSYIAVVLGQRGETSFMTFGYHRAETVGALASVLLILVMAGILVYCAILRIITPPEEFNP